MCALFLGQPKDRPTAGRQSRAPEQPTRITRSQGHCSWQRTSTMKHCSNLSPILHLGLRQSLMNNKPTQCVFFFSVFPECLEIFLFSNRMCVIQQNTIEKTIFVTIGKICLVFLLLLLAQWIVMLQQLPLLNKFLFFVLFCLEAIQIYMKKSTKRLQFVWCYLIGQLLKEILTKNTCNFREGFF